MVFGVQIQGVRYGILVPVTLRDQKNKLSEMLSNINEHNIHKEITYNVPTVKDVFCVR